MSSFSTNTFQKLKAYITNMKLFRLHNVLIYDKIGQNSLATRRLNGKHLLQVKAVSILIIITISNCVVRKTLREQFTVSTFRDTCSYYVETLDMIGLQNCRSMTSEKNVNYGYLVQFITL